MVAKGVEVKLAALNTLPQPPKHTLGTRDRVEGHEEGSGPRKAMYYFTDIWPGSEGIPRCREVRVEVNLQL